MGAHCDHWPTLYAASDSQDGGHHAQQHSTLETALAIQMPISTSQHVDMQGEPWVRIVIIGQSFMLHQIRKMVGMAVAIMRGDAPASCIKLAFDPKRLLPTPMAPDVGLFLDECYFEAYNNR